MDSIQVFNNPQFGEIRTAGTPDEPLFCLADVCRALDLHSNAVKQRLSEDVCSTYPLQTAGGMQQANFINEDGLYDVILDSRKPEAKAFRKWITSDVVPSIRKHGMYMTQDLLTQTLQNPDFLIDLLKEYKNEKEKSRMLEEKNQALLPKARYTEEVLQSDNTYTLTQVAKDLGMRSVHELTANLEKMKIMFRQSNSWLPFADYANKGYFTTRTATYDKTVGKGTSMYFVVTEKGRMWLHETFGVLAL